MHHAAADARGLQIPLKLTAGQAGPSSGSTAPARQIATPNSTAPLSFASSRSADRSRSGQAMLRCRPAANQQPSQHLGRSQRRHQFVVLHPVPQPRGKHAGIQMRVEQRRHRLHLGCVDHLADSVSGSSPRFSSKVAPSRASARSLAPKNGRRAFGSVRVHPWFTAHLGDFPDSASARVRSSARRSKAWWLCTRLEFSERPPSPFLDRFDYAPFPIRS